ncbi:IclR family transcriptional regulator [Gordonia terrae]|uniref:IclR family transcriptional regulator n=2 Tax=Gordonia terrae TaxID=2055 RepID=A0AAD0K805_9ACTN|nr:IclR family transcriptional regulator [Gordonia terrae]VTR07684.1 IclR family transcriptional regulator [Clostridioides difficile]ANY23871.1 IclR family transcriptional regulator [Gordonia terrae]AWO84605.1 IclR family transcriptional regulator [Gordonia terrae]VTS55453.1 Transcriptional regulator kdgR [Gordonia terrae]GAB42091.1 putative IclR family transcriptional regulator [Gordonia terrae NBRC 100016]
MSAVSHAFRVFEAVAQWQPIGVSAVASSLVMSKSTTQRALRALADEGWIEPSHNDSTKWVITTKAFALGSRHAGATSVRELTRTAMGELFDAFGETVHLSILDGRHLVVVELLETTAPVRTHTRIGDRFPLHATASGIAMLADMRASAIRESLDAGQPLEQLTAATPTDLASIEQRVATARTSGYAVTEGTRHEGISAIGAAVLDRGGDPFAAISVSAPSARLPESVHAEVGEQVRKAARRCSGVYNYERAT